MARTAGWVLGSYVSGVVKAGMGFCFWSRYERIFFGGAKLSVVCTGPLLLVSVTSGLIKGKDPGLEKVQ
jgi:hypothetical protein